MFIVITLSWNAITCFLEYEIVFVIFGKGYCCQAFFSEPEIIKLTFSKSPSNQFSFFSH